MLYYAIATLHILVCVILVLVVLLQSGKGADLAGAFGGGATQTAFGSRGPASFLSKMTTFAAIIFMLTSIGLQMVNTRTERKSILETGGSQSSQPAKQAPAAAPKSNQPMPSQEQIQRQVEEAQKKMQQNSAPAPKPAEPEKPGK